MKIPHTDRERRCRRVLTFAHSTSENCTEDGICEADHAQTWLKELMARRGREVYVPADPSKLGLRPFHPWPRLALPWTLLTDDGADPDQVERFRDAGGVAVAVATVAG
jgi:DeoR/GlpR family transcriptional regulator of sugar metabolism